MTGGQALQTAEARPGNGDPVPRVPAGLIRSTGACTRCPDEKQLFAPEQRLTALSPPLTLQPTLTTSRPDDPYEREADRVAERVMRMPEPAVQAGAAPFFGNNQSSPGGKGTTGGGLVQRRMSARPGGVPDVPPVVHEALRSSGQPLDSGMTAFMGSRMGYDFSRVRVHTDALAGSSARAIHASAYTAGNDIVFAPGVYAPSTPEGRHLLAHELSHVVQQGGSRQGIQRWGDDTHREITAAVAKEELRDDVVIPIAKDVTEFVDNLLPYSYSTDYKGRRIMWTGPLFLSGITKGEGPDHGEDGNYSSTNVDSAVKENKKRQNEYVAESVGYYRQVALSMKTSHLRDKSGGSIDRSKTADVLALPGPTGAIGGAVAGTMYGVGLGQMTAKAIGGFGGGLLGALVGLVSAPIGLVLGAVAGALGIGGLVSAIKSRPAGDALHGIFAALGDACHAAQDRGSHWEGVKGRGHDDERTQHGWNPDKPDMNNNERNKKDGIKEIFGGHESAHDNTRDVFRTWMTAVRALGRE